MFSQSFSITGITCDACVKLIKRRVSAISGVLDVKVESSGLAMITAEREILSEEIMNSLQGTEYKLS